MYEISTALKFLAPKLRKLSFSIISILSVVVITTVVWLTIVFFSATEGFETRWTEKLIGITAPIRIIPKDAYYSTYYNLIDSQSAKSNYSQKSIEEKLNSKITDPYDPLVDPELPADFPKPILDENGNMVDLLKVVQDAALQSGEKNLFCTPFNMAFANLKLKIVRKTKDNGTSQQLLSQASYLLNFNPKKMEENSQLAPIKPADLTNILSSIEELSFKNNNLSKYLTDLFEEVSIDTVKTKDHSWSLPISFIPEDKKFKAYLYNSSILLPSDKYSQFNGKEGTLVKLNNKILFTAKDGEKVSLINPNIVVEENTIFKAKLIPSSINPEIRSYEMLEFELTGSIQGETVHGISYLDDLEISSIHKNRKNFLLFGDVKNKTVNLPSQGPEGAGVILPVGFRESGVLVGDSGYISYFAPSLSQLQEQKIPVYVAGFYDPGIIPVGGRLLLASDEVVSNIRAVEDVDTQSMPVGLNVNFSNFRNAKKVATHIREVLEKKGLAPYFSVETYYEYEFSRNVFQQLRSEKNLFSLIAIIIVIVACSNIISMLIILVNDKYKEIAIMRALGATKVSIGFIFGFSGFLMGAIGSILGTLIGCLTVKNLSGLLSFLGKLQGYEVLNPIIYGDVVPTEISTYAVILVVVATATISTLAGIMAAVQASCQNTSEALRTE